MQEFPRRREALEKKQSMVDFFPMLIELTLISRLPNLILEEKEKLLVVYRNPDNRVNSYAALVSL